MKAREIFQSSPDLLQNGLPLIPFYTVADETYGLQCVRCPVLLMIDDCHHSVLPRETKANHLGKSPNSKLELLMVTK